MTPMSEEIKDEAARIRDLQNQRGDAEARLQLADTIVKLREQLAEQRKEIETLQTRNNELSNTGYSDAWQIGDLKKEIEELRAEIEKSEKAGLAFFELAKENTQKLGAAQRLCQIYFEIAEEYITADEIRKKVDSKITENK